MLTVLWVLLLRVVALRWVGPLLRVGPLMLTLNGVRLLWVQMTIMGRMIHHVLLLETMVLLLQVVVLRILLGVRLKNYLERRIRSRRVDGGGGFPA